MTQAGEPRDRDLDRTLRTFDRRLTRLEETQITGRELAASFDRVYEEIDAPEAQMNQRFDVLEREISTMRTELTQVNGKIDTILRHITGMNNS